MTHRLVRNGASILALALGLLLTGCGGAAPSSAALDEKVAAAQQAADRAEKAQKATEDAVRSLAQSGVNVSYDEALDADEQAAKTRSDDDVSVAHSGGDEGVISTETRINSDGVEELVTPDG